MKRPTFFTITCSTTGNKHPETSGVLNDLGQSAVRSEVAAPIDDISGPGR